jgi:hypothetical protein
VEKQKGLGINQVPITTKQASHKYRTHFKKLNRKQKGLGD